jgi:hypothetical protein
MYSIYMGGSKWTRWEEREQSGAPRLPTKVHPRTYPLDDPMC